MTKTIRNLSIWTLIMNMLILIGAGHGVVPLGMFELLSISHLGNLLERLSFSFSISFEQRLPVVILFSLMGQMLMLLSFAPTDVSLKAIMVFCSIVGMSLGLLYLSSNLINDNSSMFSFITALPFVALSIWLLVSMYKYLKAQDA